MNLIFRSMTALMLILVSGLANAQQNPNNPGGFLNTDPRSPYYNSGNNLPPTETRHQERWAARWGAYAIATSGASGGVQDMESKRVAENEAMSKCRRAGGDDCKILISYYNQCGAVASGDGGSGGGSAETERQAVYLAMDSCQKRGSNCQLYFMGCSLPVKIN